MEYTVVIHYINRLARLWRKKVDLLWNLFKNAQVEKVHGKVFVSKNGLSGSMSRSFKGYNVTYQCIGLDQSNIVCEYDANPLTNDKVITEIQNCNAKG